MREKGESQVGNWWCNCWRLVSSYLGFSGLLSGRAGFFLAFQSLSLSRSGQTWQPVYFSLFFPSRQPLYSSQSLSFSSLISFLSYYWGLIPLSMFLFFSFHPSFQTVRHHAESSGLEKSSRRGGSAASRRSKVCLQQDRAGEGANTDSVSPFHPFSSTQARPTPQQQDYYSCSCWYSWAQRRSWCWTRGEANEVPELVLINKQCAKLAVMFQ